MNLIDALVVMQTETPAPEAQATLGEAIMNILGNPVSIVTILFGSLILLASIGYFGYVTAGALVDLVFGDVMESPARRPPRQQ
jgi:hypothetical protein